jgi:hypothetical protein
LSDEFGVGFAGLLIEDEFNAGQFADISIALGDPQKYQDIRQKGETQPDYLMWAEAPSSPYYVVECKGCQSRRATCFDQLRRGLEQVPSIRFGTGTRQVITLVVATCLEETGTTVFVIDPPPDDAGPPHDERSNPEWISERTGPRSWNIRNAEAFDSRMWLAQESWLLKWAGHYSEAFKRDSELEPLAERRHGIPHSAPKETMQTDFGTFVGTTNNAFPELGRKTIRVFTGVEEELFASVADRRPRAREIAGIDQARFRADRQRVRKQSPFISVGSNGTCMIVEGL